MKIAIVVGVVALYVCATAYANRDILTGNHPVQESKTQEDTTP